jgi:HlyD family secretion protein
MTGTTTSNDTAHLAAQAWPARMPTLIGYITLFMLVFCFGGWSVTTTISGAIIASGKIEVAQNRQIVQHPDGGVVEWINVVEGQAVKAGDTLVRLAGDALKSELKIVEGQLVELAARHDRLVAERDNTPTVTFRPGTLAAALQNAAMAEQVEGQRTLFHARKENLAQQFQRLTERGAQISSKISGLNAQLVALETQRGLINQELTAQQELLNKGLTQGSRVMLLQREQAQMSGEIGALSASLAEAKGRITETQIEALQLSASRREEASTQLRDIGNREIELVERQRALAERVARLDIIAPVSGTVLELQVTTPRAVLRPADPVLHLIPQDRPLVIAVKVTTFQIDQLSLGQPVTLVFSAFPARTTPELAGHITVISADALTDPRSQQLYYRVEIAPAAGELEKLKGLKLLPGMPVEAFIRTEDRTPLAYLLKPFTDYFTRAFREG